MDHDLRTSRFCRPAQYCKNILEMTYHYVLYILGYFTPDAL